MAETPNGRDASTTRPILNLQTDPDAPPKPDASVKPTKSQKKPRGILKPLPPPTQTQRLNATLQTSFSNFKRDLFSGFMPQTAAAAGPSTSAGQNNNAPPSPAAAAAGQPTQNVTMLNTHSNAGSSLWKTMSTRLTTLDPVQAASQLPLLGSGASSSPQNLSVRGLRGVRFRMNCLTVTYPLGNAAPVDEGATRDSINASHRKRIQQQNLQHWSPQELVKFYDDCCRSREEVPLQRIRNALLNLTEPKEMDLTGLQLNLGAAEALSDVLSIDFGLKKLILDSCVLDDEVSLSKSQLKDCIGFNH